MRSHPMDGPRRRLDRAWEHFDNLDVEIRRYLERGNGDAYDMLIEHDPQPHRYRLRLQVFEEPDLARWSLITADCVNNLRAALDNLIWQVGLRHRSPARLGKLSFPICLISSDFDAKRPSLDRLLPPGATAVLDGLQPYRRTDEPRWQVLYMLNRLWGDDKHQSPPLVIAELSGGITPVDVHLEVTGEPFHHDAIIARATVPSDAEPHFKPSLSFDVALDEKGPAQGRRLRNLLANAHNLIRYEVFPQFDRFFS